MPIEDMLISMLGKKGLSTTMEVRQYFQAIEREEQTVSKQNYLRQRQKIDPEVFKRLNRNYLKRFYGGQEAAEWRGYLVLAVDGSGAEIPNSMENRAVYGASENQYGKGVARCNVSALHDVLNRFLLDIQIDRYNSSEKEAAKAHIPELRAIIGERPALILCDRNYISLEFMDFLEKSGIKYLIRLHKDDYTAERAQMRGNDGEVEIRYTNSRLERLRREQPQRAQELARQGCSRVRIIKTLFANGEPAAFITNLKERSRSEILRLYRKRWSIEQKYHTLKNKMRFESVTGRASIYVAQDFWAQTLVFNIVQDLIHLAEYRAVKKAKKKKLKYQVRINENIAIGLFKEQFIRLMTEEDALRKAAMYQQLIANMEQNIVPVRKLKNSPRKWRYWNKYKCNLKPSF